MNPLQRIGGSAPIWRTTPTQTSTPVREADAPGLPGEQVSLSGARAPAPKTEVARFSPSALHRLKKWTGIAALAVVGSTSLLGGIAYMGNHQALVAPTVHVYPNQLAAPAVKAQPSHAAAPVKRPPAPQPAAAPSAPGAEIAIPMATLRQWMNSPQMQKAVSAQLVQAQGQIDRQIGAVKVPSGNVLLDVTLPLPTGQKNLLHIGGVNLPSLGYHALQTDTVPMTVSYSADTVHTGLRSSVAQVRKAPEKGPGVWIGGVKVIVSAPDGQIPVAGAVNLGLDLDGSAAKAQIARLRNMPGQEKLVAELQSRVDRGQRLQKELKRDGLEDLASAALNQNLAFQGHVSTGKGPLVQTTLNVWVVPDRNGDGKPELQITQENNVDALRNLEVGVDSIGGDKAPSGLIDGIVHDQARKALISNLKAQIPQLNQQIQQTAMQEVQHQLRAQAGGFQGQANGQLGQVYAHHLNVPGLGTVDHIKVGPGGVLLEMPGVPGGDAVGLDTRGLQAGQVAVAVNRTTLNQQLAQQVNWDSLLQKTGGAGGQLSWAKDAKGQPIHPELRAHDGKLFLHAEMNAKSGGPSAGFAGPMSMLNDVDVALDIPLNFRTNHGKLVVDPNLQGAELQRLQAGGMDLTKLVPASTISGLLAGHSMQQSVDASKWGNAHFDSVRVSPQGNLTVVVGTAPGAMDWATRSQ